MDIKIAISQTPPVLLDLAALVILNVKNADLGTFLGKCQRSSAAHAGSAASDNGHLAGQATIQGFGTCSHDVSPETGSDAFAAVDDQSVPGHEGGHVRCQEQDRISDFIGAAPTPHRDSL